MDDATESATPSATVRSLGRGGLAITGAKVYFILQGLVQQILLPRALGLEGYGALSSALSIASIAYNPVTTTSIQGVSRAVAQAPAGSEAVTLRRVLRVHAVVALLLAGLFWSFAPLLGSGVGAPHIITPLRWLSGVMLLYGVYTPLVGALNGQRRFVGQALLDVLAATLRTVGLVSGAFFFQSQTDQGVQGAAIGFLGAASAVLFTALFMVGIGKSGAGGVRSREHLGFVLPLFLGQLLLNLLFQADLTLLRRFASDAARVSGLPLTAADPLVGAYRATQLFAFLPYQILMAVTLILFPMLATAARDGDRAAIARYVRAGTRLSLLVAGLVVSITAGLSRPLLRLVFSERVAELGSDSMVVLSLGFGAFAVFGVLTTVLNSLHHERASAAVTAFALLLVLGVGVWRVPGTELGAALLWRTALATTLGLGVATLSAGYLVHRAARAVLAPRTLVSALLAGFVAVGTGQWLSPMGSVQTLLSAAGVGLLYLGVLVLIREIGREDWMKLRAIAARR